MNKAEFFDTLRTERARWDELLSQIDTYEHYLAHAPTIRAWLEKSEEHS